MHLHVEKDMIQTDDLDCTFIKNIQIVCVHVGLLVYVLSLFVFVFCAVCVRTAHTCLRTSLEFVDGSLS